VFKGCLQCNVSFSKKDLVIGSTALKPFIFLFQMELPIADCDIVSFGAYTKE